ncbi:hypothetical protein EB118_13670 [bacterium]|nr:hypothetical protein [bacterium]
MPYSERTKETIKHAPRTLGSRLGRWAIHRDFSVLRISKFTGATRQTVYNWMSGMEVTPAYRSRVQELINILERHPNAEQAWRHICDTYPQQA